MPNKPEVLTLIDLLRAFVSFREEVISRRTKFLLRKARDRAHVLVGLAIAVANIDEVIRVIRQAPDPQTAREQLMERRWPSADVESLGEREREREKKRFKFFFFFFFFFFFCFFFFFFFVFCFFCFCFFVFVFFCF